MAAVVILAVHKPRKRKFVNKRIQTDDSAELHRLPEMKAKTKRFKEEFGPSESLNKATQLPVFVDIGTSIVPLSNDRETQNPILCNNSTQTEVSNQAIGNPINNDNVSKDWSENNNDFKNYSQTLMQPSATNFANHSIETRSIHRAVDEHQPVQPCLDQTGFKRYSSLSQVPRIRCCKEPSSRHTQVEKAKDSTQVQTDNQKTTEKLTQTPNDHAADHIPRANASYTSDKDDGRFSVASARPYTPSYSDDDRYSIPSARTLTPDRTERPAQSAKRTKTKTKTKTETETKTKTKTVVKQSSTNPEENLSLSSSLYGVGTRTFLLAPEGGYVTNSDQVWEARGWKPDGSI